MQKQDKLNEIYAAALTVFSEYGYKKATLEDIAAQLGLTKGALYQYAKSKKDLYYRTVEFSLLNWQCKVFDAVSKETDVEKQFIVLCKMACIYLSEDIMLKKILIKDPSIFPISFNTDPFKTVNNTSMNFLRSILDKGISENKFRRMDTELMTRFLFSIYKMLIIETYVLEEQDANIDSVIDIITQGFFSTK